MDAEAGSCRDPTKFGLDVKEWKDRAAGAADAICLFCDTSRFDQVHRTAQGWLHDRAQLRAAHGEFGPLLAKITALHLMMDLGLKTIQDCCRT